jgi:hypothetical protein
MQWLVQHPFIFPAQAGHCINKQVAVVVGGSLHGVAGLPHWWHWLRIHP